MSANIDYPNTLFQSIDTIVSARIANLPYDQTVECYVVNNDQADQGIYKVKYQNAEFEAVSDNTDFKIDERVYVQIPQGDFDQDKIIIRKKQLEEKQKVKKLPLLSMAKSANFFTAAQNEETYSLKIESSETIGTKTFIWNNTTYAGYTKLGLKASIMSDIPYTMLSGDYGFKIDITSYDQSNITTKLNNSEKNTETYYLKIEDMIGANFYNTNGYQNQEKVIDITNKVITSIKISFWQDGKFLSQEYGQILNKFIYYTNLQLYIGYDVSEFDENPKLFLYSEDGLQYSTSSNSKTLKTRLLTLDKETLFFTENNNLFLTDNSLNMNWGKYNIANNSFSELYNQLAYETINTSKNFILSTELSTIRSKVQEQYICAISQNNGNALYRSNILTFKNATYLAGSNIIDIITGLQATVLEDNGIYQFYGQDNVATNKIAVSVPHYLLLTYLSSNEESNDNGIKVGDKIIWKIPKYRTMILAPKLNIEYKQRNEDEGCITDDENYWIITQVIQASDLDSANAYRIPFYISDYYSPQNTNNTIYCQLQRGFDIYETSKELQFGTSGSQGNEYNLRLRMWKYNDKYQDGKEYVNAYYMDSDLTDPYFIEVELYDYNNNLVNITNAKYKLLYDTSSAQQFSFDTNYNRNLISDGKTTAQIVKELFENYSNNSVGNTSVESDSIINTTYICLKRISNSTNLLDYYTNVIEGSITIGDKEYKAYLPLAVASSQAYTAISGSTVITYDITGKKPFYTKTPFTIETISSGTFNWYIYAPNNLDTAWAPQLAATGINEQKELIPPTIFKNDSNQKFAVVCATTVGNSPVWVQPIHIIQNKYPGVMENGETNYAYINSEEYVAHTMVGRINEDTPLAGSTNPTMSGLFIGVLGNITNDTEKLGLYAFKQGRKFFCVDEDGLLYLDGGLDLNSRIANITLNNCKLEDNLFDFTEGTNEDQNDIDVIRIRDNTSEHNTTIAINSSGRITSNEYSLTGLTQPSIVVNKTLNRNFNILNDRAYFYGTAAYAESIQNQAKLIDDLNRIQQALASLGKNITITYN